jgi:hypothetical protein
MIRYQILLKKRPAKKTVKITQATRQIKKVAMKSFKFYASCKIFASLLSSPAPVPAKFPIKYDILVFQ